MLNKTNTNAFDPFRVKKIFCNLNIYFIGKYKTREIALH